MANLEKIDVKFIQNALGVCNSTAKSYYKDIKKEYDLKHGIVLKHHFLKYFNVE